ncbi:MAG: hypothetical protein KC519_18850 [Anaerolineae bacterium]|nr:hypothetical protein [Anaerolineae bacterium]
MIGAGIAAQADGSFRNWLGDYHLIFLSAAIMGFIATQLTLRIGASARPVTAGARA